MSDNKEFQTVNRSEKGKVGARNVRDKTKYNNKSSNKEHTEQERPRLSFKEVLYELNNLKKHLHSPKVDLRERDNSYIIRMEVPGLSKGDLSVKLVDSQFLLISGNKLNTNVLENDTVIYNECHYGSFMRRVKVPVAVNYKSLDLTVENGVLTLVVQKLNLTPRPSSPLYGDSDNVPVQLTGDWADQ